MSDTNTSIWGDKKMVMATVTFPPSPEIRRYRCAKGHEWTGQVFQHPYFRVVGEAGGKVVVVESDPCPFCYVEFFRTLPQAEEVPDVQSH